MTLYRKKPLLVDAVPVNDILESNPVPEWVAEAMKPVDETDEGYGATARVTLVPNGIDIVTKQGQVVTAHSGEWLLRAASDDLWPVDGPVFEASYERPDVMGPTEFEEPPLEVWTVELDRAVAHIQNVGRMLGHVPASLTGEALRETIAETLVGFTPSGRLGKDPKEYDLELVSAIASAIEQPVAVPEDLNELLRTPDAAVWATAFIEEFGHRRADIDVGLMISWFANALAAGAEQSR